VIRVYYDNVIVSGRIVEDLGPAEVAAVKRNERAHEFGVIWRVTSRQAWREQEGAPEPLRSTLHAARGDLSVVASDHVVLGAAALEGLYGTSATLPLVTDIVDQELFRDLKALWLRDSDAKHLMYAAHNNCVRFLMLDRHFLKRKPALEARCGAIIILKPSELVRELIADGLIHDAV